MASGISTMNIRQFFRHLVEQNFPKAGIGDPDVMSYVTDLLERTSYKTGSDNPVSHDDTLFDMLKAREGLQDPFARTVADKRIGDHALIKSGLFYGKSTDMPYYASSGRSSYAGVGKYYKREGKKNMASLFDDLSYCFDGCVQALNVMRQNDLDIESGGKYDLLFMPRDVKTTVDLMLDAVIRWKKGKDPGDKKIAFLYAERIGIKPEELPL